MELPRDPAYIRRREALPLAVNPDLVAARGTALGRRDAVCGTTKCPQKGTLLADCVDRRFHPRGGCPAQGRPKRLQRMALSESRRGEPAEAARRPRDPA